jgi:Xaa-Pro dipeptidase
MQEEMVPCELTPREEVFSRIRAFQKRLQETHTDAALLIQNVDLFYFTGTVQTGCLFIPRDGEPLFLVQKDYARAAAESPLRCVKIGSMKELPDLLQEEAGTYKRVGMELDVIPVALFDRIRGLFPGWEIPSVSVDIKEVRSVKSDFEIEQIKKSGEMITGVFSRVKNHLREGMTELELDGILISIGRALGHQGFLRMRGLNQEMMNIQVVSGESGSVTSYCDTPLCGRGATPAVAQGSSTRKIRRDEPVVIDYGGGYNGYVTDETRVFVLGRLKDRLQKAYQVALDILRETESFAGAGELPSRIYTRAQEIAAIEGLAENFMGYGQGKVAFVGHGLGLEINELPIISKGGRNPLQTGMVFALEPKFVFPGEGAVGIELDYIVGEKGLERVTRFPKEIICL